MINKYLKLLEIRFEEDTTNLNYSRVEIAAYARRGP
ncbi:hypothetical protein ES703_122629 [subsurface metagenome]|jgi:hypothetical protein